MAEPSWVLDLSSTPPKIYNGNGAGAVHNALEPPYPSYYWYIERDPKLSITNAAYKPAKVFGSFMYCANLSYVEIPHSCKSIGRYAFAGTALKKVKIARDCTYYDTSFPEGCEIEYYGGGGQWGQLLDGDGYAVIDGDGARVYIEEEI